MSRHLSHADSRFDADGYQYGVRFHDGSVKSTWNGRTQRQRAEEFITESYAWVWSVRPAGNFIDRFVLVRRRPEEPWEVVSRVPHDLTLAADRYPPLARAKVLDSRRFPFL